MNALEAVAALRQILAANGELGASDEGQRAVSVLDLTVRNLADNLESTTWSSGCWCSGKDKRGHAATCESRRAAIRETGRIPPGGEG